MGNTLEGLFKEAITEYIANNYEKSIEYLKLVLQMDPQHRLAGLTIGSALLKLGRAEKALEQFNHIIEADPGYARAYHLRGFAHQQLGDSEAALKDFSTAIHLDGEYGAAYYSRATLLSEMGKSELAGDDIEVVTRLTNRNLEVFGNQNNVWRSRQLYVESEMGSEFDQMVGSA
ncbi:MAG: tetratricopeptide repeat protein [Deltaproteobacteria bacterium]|jgi:tetratricopeptide (TPR) repeat protein|nr:tetratricopeptide repeat protein [Deltaproteobacteria bacterium]